MKQQSPELCYFFAISLGLLLQKIINEYQLKALYLSYVPLSQEKFKQRGFNQSKLIAKTLYQLRSHYGLESKLYFLDDLFVRIKDTKPLAKLSLDERNLELDGAFSINSKFEKFIERFAYESESRVLIIDDITTTGLSFIKLTDELNQRGLPTQKIIALACTGRNF